MNDLNLSDAEIKIVFLIRKMGLFDSIEIKCAKQGELMWIFTKKDSGKFEIEVRSVL